MNWSSVANNQTFSFNTLQNAVTNGYFTAKTAIPASSRIVNVQSAQDYVYIQPIAKPTNQLVVKSDMVAVSGTPTWYGGFVSDSGQYQTVINSTTGYLWDSSDFGASWTPNTGAGALGWLSISISGNGVYRVATTVSDTIYVSINSGANWSVAFTAPSTVNAIGTAITDNGETMYVTLSGDYVRKSTNYGTSFSSITTLGQQGWNFPSVASAGQYVLIPYGNGLKRSTDYGATWFSAGSSLSYITSAMSDSGQYQITAATIGGDISVSSNYGSSFASISTGSVTNKYFYSSAMYASGEFMLIADNSISNPIDNGWVWRSSDFGASFNKITSLGQAAWEGVGFGGQYALAVAPTAVYRSTNYGNSWTQVL